MDVISIENLKITATIGLLDWERQIKQALYFDISWQTDVAKIACNDEIGEGLDYTAVSMALQEFVEQSDFHLIETLAEKVAAFLLTKFKMKWLRLKLTKPGIISNAKSVSVTIERHFMITN